MNNLIDNAIRFTNEGRVTVVLTSVEVKGVQHVVINVRDTGIGIAPELHSNVMELFQQADSAFTREYGGIGLGLTIAQRLVHALGGTLKLTSTPNEGSEFQFTLPATPLQSDASNRTDQEELSHEVILPRRILVAEDNGVNRKFIVHILKKNGHDVAWVENGQEVLDYIQSEQVDVILMDCQMPVMSGYEASMAIRKAEKLTQAYLPIIAVTAHALPENETLCRDAGMDFFISKPFQTKHLLALVDEAARRSVAASGRSTTPPK